MRLEFIKHERQELYSQLLFSAGLDKHLVQINKRVTERILELIHQIAQRQGVTEELKARVQMACIGVINAIKAQAEEIAINEIIYE